MSQRCSRCGIVKPLSEFWKRASSPTGHNPACKECAKTRAEPERIWLARDEMKRCGICDKIKPFSEFHKQSTNPTGHVHACKRCRQETRYPDAEKNRQARQRLRDAGLKHCWQCKQIKPFHDFYNAASERDGKTGLCKLCHAAYRREFRKNNRETTNRQSQDWCRRNPDKRRAAIERRRAREKCAEGNFVADDIKRIRTAQNNICVYCGLNPNCHGVLFSYQIDHITPLSRGGTNYPDNIQLLCVHCNNSKRDKTHSEYIEWLSLHYSS